VWQPSQCDKGCIENLPFHWKMSGENETCPEELYGQILVTVQLYRSTGSPWVAAFAPNQNNYASQTGVQIAALRGEKFNRQKLMIQEPYRQQMVGVREGREMLRYLHFLI